MIFFCFFRSLCQRRALFGGNLNLQLQLQLKLEFESEWNSCGRQIDFSCRLLHATPRDQRYRLTAGNPQFAVRIAGQWYLECIYGLYGYWWPTPVAKTQHSPWLITRQATLTGDNLHGDQGITEHSLRMRQSPVAGCKLGLLRYHCVTRKENMDD